MKTYHSNQVCKYCRSILGSILVHNQYCFYKRVSHYRSFLSRLPVKYFKGLQMPLKFGKNFEKRCEVLTGFEPVLSTKRSFKYHALDNLAPGTTETYSKLF